MKLLEVRRLEDCPPHPLDQMLAWVCGKTYAYKVIGEPNEWLVFETREEAFRFRRLVAIGRLVQQGVNHSEAIKKVDFQLSMENN